MPNLSRWYPGSALDAMRVPRKMRRPDQSVKRSSVLDVPDPRSDQNPFPRVHRHHHHGSPQKGPEKCLDTGLASAAARTAAARRARFYAAFRAGAGGSGHAGIMVVADPDPDRE